MLRPKRDSVLLHLRDRVLRRHSGEVRRLLLEDLQDRLQGASLQCDHAKLQKAVDQEVR